MNEKHKPCRALPFLAALVVFLIIGLRAGAATVVAVNADAQYQYAEYLFKAKDYPSAVNEYRRFIYLFPHDIRKEAAMYKIGLSYASSAQYDPAVQAFSSLIDEFVDTENAVQAFFRIGEIYIDTGRPALAVTNLHNLIAVAEDPDVRDEANYRIGWIYLEMTEWEQARTYFGRISPNNIKKYRIRELNDGLNAVALEKKKSPTLAGTLSIVPGGGYLYLERYQDALVAFLLNGGLIYAAYEAFDHELYALAGVIAFVEVGFYSGNIYGAVSGAHKYNRNKDRGFVEQLKEKLRINLSFRPAEQGVQVALHFDF